jgi:hypothetical protein
MCMLESMSPKPVALFTVFPDTSRALSNYQSAKYCYISRANINTSISRLVYFRPPSLPAVPTFPLTDCTRDGVDGSWSSFTVQIGTPPQNVKVFISTASNQIWVVDPSGCVSGDPTNCPKLRGGTYNYTASSTWIPNTANITTQIYALGLEEDLGYAGKGRYGFDTVALGIQGSGGPALQNQTVAGIATKDFYLGIFGLNPNPSSSRMIQSRYQASLRP